MLKKCYKPYTDFHGCKIDDREAKLQKMKEEFGEDKFNRSEAQVKAMLAKKLGKEQADKIWDYQKDYNSRFKELRKALDDEMGVIRDGQKIPDIDYHAVTKTPATATGGEQPKTATSHQESESGFKGWWSQPESRFKKKKKQEDA
jgi:hydroxylamine reductase (hybrid-cluster protein)